MNSKIHTTTSGDAAEPDGDKNKELTGFKGRGIEGGSVVWWRRDL